MLDQDKIIVFLQTSGPTVPSKVAKDLGTDTIIASAHLSVLASQGKVKISKLNMGGSPLYFLPGQEDQLYPFAAGNVNPKELEVLKRLKEEQVLREIDLDLLSKVALRSLRDFATPLHVTIKSKRELFWRWHLLSNDDTKRAIERILSLPPSEEEKPALDSLQGNESLSTVEMPASAVAADKPESALLSINSTKGKADPEKVKRSLVKSKRKELKTNHSELIAEEKRTAPSLTSNQNQLLAKTEPSPAAEKVKSTTLSPDTLVQSVTEYFGKLGISSSEISIVRKNSELTLKARVPSVIGKAVYFCKVKHKHRVDEKDLASAYVEAQVHKLPLLFLYTSQISKKAEQLLKSETFANAIVKKVE